MKRISVSSSAIQSIGYNPEKEILEVEFKETGDIYQYYDVSAQLYQELLRADSIGHYFNRYIKDRHEEYQL